MPVRKPESADSAPGKQSDDNADMNTEWLGYVAATLTSASFIPQAVMTIRTRETQGISRGMYVIFTVGVAFWLGYGIVIDSWPMILANTVTLGLAGTILAMKLRYG
jgi:MtN3 and saliva related transmembrane protein